MTFCIFKSNWLDIHTCAMNSIVWIHKIWIMKDFKRTQTIHGYRQANMLVVHLVDKRQYKSQINLDIKPKPFYSGFSFHKKQECVKMCRKQYCFSSEKDVYHCLLASIIALYQDIGKNGIQKSCVPILYGRTIPKTYSHCSYFPQ